MITTGVLDPAFPVAETIVTRGILAYDDFGDPLCTDYLTPLGGIPRRSVYRRFSLL